MSGMLHVLLCNLLFCISLLFYCLLHMMLRIFNYLHWSQSFSIWLFEWNMFFFQNWPLNYLSWYSLPTYLLQPEVWYYYNKTLLMQISREQVSSGICWEGSWRRQSSWVFLMRSAIQFGFAGTCVLCKLTWSVKKWKKKEIKD